MQQKKVYRVLAVIFGIFLLVIGLDGFLHFLPPPEYNEEATTFLTALFNVGYIFVLIPLILLLAGLSFVIDKYVPLMALVLLPITTSMLLFHIFLDFSSGALAIIMFGLNVYLLVMHSSKYKAILEA